MLGGMDGRGRLFLFNMGKVPIYAQIWALVLIFYGYNAVSNWAICPTTELRMVALAALILTILLHEMGHALLASLFRLEQVTITITAIGGLCSYEGQPSAWQKLLISCAGPLTNFLLAGASWLLLRPGIFTEDITRVFLASMLYWNLLLGIFNSFPVYPLDGGHCVFALARGFSRNLAIAKRITLWISVAAAVLLVGLEFTLRAGQDHTRNLLLLGFLLFQAYTFLSPASAHDP